jgi:predicted O-methyltransferase YrrM
MFRELIRRSVLKKINSFYRLDGWLSEQEAMGLYLTARKLPHNATVVEIGSWQGKSTYCLAKGLKSGRVHAIDPFNADGGFNTDNTKLYQTKKGESNLLTQFKENMQELGVLEDIIIKEGYSSQFHQHFDKIDLLFIDGDHTIKGCTADFDLYAPKVVPGGFIAFHDYYEDRDELGPTYVIKNLVCTSGRFKLYRRYDSLWIGRKV